MQKKPPIVLILLLAAVWADAQPPHTFTRYGRENNFSGTTVEDMAQDSHGQLWLATWGGLYSFDGRTFQNYLTGNPEDRDNPRSNHFLDVEILDDDILVVSYDNRLYRLGRDARALSLVDTRGQAIQAMHHPSPGTLCFQTTGGELLDASFSPFCRIPDNATLRSVIAGPDGRTWFLTERGIWRNGTQAAEIPAFCAAMANGVLYIGSSAGELLRYQEDQLSSVPTQLAGDITFISQVPGQPELLLGTDRGSFELYNPDEGTHRHVAMEGGSSGGEGSYAGLSDVQENLWVYSTQGSLNWYDPQTNRLVPFLNKDLQQGWNSETGITALLSDRQGNLWIGSSWGGLERVVFHRDHFKIKVIDESRQISPENSVRALFQDESGWLIAATRDSRLHAFDESLNERGAWNLPYPAYALTRSHDGCLWVGTRGAGLVEMTPQSGEQLRFIQLPHPKDDLFYGPNSNDIYSLLEDGSHRLWIGTFDDGVAYIDLDAHDRPFISKKNRLSFPTDRRNRIRCLAFSPDGRLYAGGQMGLFVCAQPSGEPEDMHFERFSQIPDYDIQHILFTSQGELYLCSYGAGLLKFENGDPDSPFQSWTVNEGLLSNYTFSAVEDRSGNLWIATRAGLNRLNLQTGSLIGYPYDRLGFNLRFNEGQPIQRPDGSICFNTTAGIFYFNPEEISNNNFIPELVVQALYIAGERQSLNGNEPLRIRRSDGIRVQVAALDLTAPEQVLYSYKLDGAGGDWVRLGHQTMISLPPQCPGRYTQRIRSTNGDGLAVDNERTVPIVVRRQFLQSGWAGLLYLALAGGGVFLLTRPRRRTRKTDPVTEEDPLLRGLHGDDRRFVESFTRLLDGHLDDSTLDVSRICSELNISRSVLFGKCRKLLGTTPATFLRRLRLERAQALIREGGRTMADISYAVGFNDPHYFSKIFRQEFGMTPKEYRLRQKQEG